MFVAVQSVQSGFLYSRFSQESRFLVKELVKENDHEVNERIPESLYFRDLS